MLYPPKHEVRRSVDGVLSGDSKVKREYVVKGRFTGPEFISSLLPVRRATLLRTSCFGG
jgi:hypothetical protein